MSWRRYGVSLLLDMAYVVRNQYSSNVFVLALNYALFSLSSQNTPELLHLSTLKKLREPKNPTGETRNLGLKRTTDQWGPQKIRFEFNDKGTLMPLGDHSSQWSNLLGEIVRYQQGHRAAFSQDLHRQQVNVEERVLGLEVDGTRDVEGIRSRRLVSITPADWGSRSVGVLQDMQMESSKTRERGYDRNMYEEMLRLKDLGTNMSSVVPYTEDEIMAKVRAGKQWRHIPGVGRALAGRARDVLTINETRCMHTADKDEVKALRKEINIMMKVVRSGDKMS
ncbi:hypothetical protein Tco_0668186 [Tanacetum coccineum]